jgi:hypothetical protein
VYYNHPQNHQTIKPSSIDRRLKMMAGPLLLVASWMLRPSAASFTPLKSAAAHGQRSSRLFSSASVDAHNGISRLATLQTLLTKYGAPGSIGCSEPNDLVPLVTDHPDEKPELLSALEATQVSNLHPHLFPLAKSQSTGHYICGLRRVSDATHQQPWPIVESAPGARGMRLLALNSEHLMRRMAAESDFVGDPSGIVKMYNAYLGQGVVKDIPLDVPYISGSVEKLGYGPQKYILLKVGPFPDLYEAMAMSHAAKGDEASSLIAAEAANGKFTGFGSTFRFYATLLNTFPNRADETRDAARVCWRVPLPSLGMLDEDFKQVAVLGKVAQETDSMEEVFAKMHAYYVKLRKHEEEDPGSSGGKTPEQSAIEEGIYLLDSISLSATCNWNNCRRELGEIYASVGQTDMAAFVDPTRLSAN